MHKSQHNLPIISPPVSKYMFEITTNSHDNTLSVRGGMIPEICFGKWYASVVGMTFINPTVLTPTRDDIDLDCIHNTVEYIAYVINGIDMHLTDVAVLSPGFLSLPYVLELMDCVYLPTTLMITVNSMSRLDAILEQARVRGIDCCAEVGIDNAFTGHLVAYIKLLEIPPAYQRVLTKHCVSEIVTMGIHGIGSKGNNIARRYTLSSTSRSNITVVYTNQGIYSRPEEELSIRTRALDFNSSSVGDRVYYVFDWKTGIRNPFDMTESLKLNSQIRHMLFQDYQCMELTSWWLSMVFITKNGITPRGHMFNPYMISDPLKETTYGFIGYVFWDQDMDIWERFIMLRGNERLPELWVKDTPEGLGIYANIPYTRKITHVNQSGLNQRPNRFNYKLIKCSELQYIYNNIIFSNR